MTLVATKFECTHKQAVKRVAAWLLNTKRYPVVMAERVCVNVNEQPDVIGWRGNGHSILVECKVSRSDFHADKDKAFRKFEEFGVGELRYYAAPRGVLTADDLPNGWGLLEIHEHRIMERIQPAPKAAQKQAEIAMLVAAMRRLEMAATVFVRHDEDTATKDGA